MPKNKRPATILNAEPEPNPLPFPKIPNNLSGAELQKVLAKKALDDVFIFADADPLFAMDLCKEVISKCGSKNWLLPIIEKELHKVQTGRYPTNTWKGDEGKENYRRLLTIYQKHLDAGASRENTLKALANMFGYTGEYAYKKVETRITKARKSFK